MWPEAIKLVAGLSFLVGIAIGLSKLDDAFNDIKRIRELLEKEEK